VTITHLSCSCGKVTLELTGPSIINAECCCTSCRSAGDRIEALPGAPRFRTPFGATPYVLARKDRIRFTGGMEHLAEFRLTPKSHTRRIVATCCNSPVFTEFQGGHWLSLYGNLWPAGTLPRMDLRTMTADLPDASVLPNDIPNAKGQNGRFFARLLGAWVAMGFRVPKIAIARTLPI
jgi:hypothetical protein